MKKTEKFSPDSPLSDMTGGNKIGCKEETNHEHERDTTMATATEKTAIRYSADCSICMVWRDGEPLRCATQHDMDTLPVGEDMTDEEVESLA